MVARNRIRCTVIAVRVSEDGMVPRGALEREVLPWADPYVAQLIRKLQDEVREERRERSRVRHYNAGSGESGRSTTRSRFAVGDMLDSFAEN